MNNEEIIRMAREACSPYQVLNTDLEFLTRFAAIVAAHERENCANLREEIILYGAPNEDYEDGFWDGLASYEAAIKARSHK